MSLYKGNIIRTKYTCHMVCVQREKFKILSVNFKVNITMKLFWKVIIYIDRCAKKCVYKQNQIELQIDNQLKSIDEHEHAVHMYIAALPHWLTASLFFHCRKTGRFSSRTRCRFYWCPTVEPFSEGEGPSLFLLEWRCFSHYKTQP